MVLTRLTNFVVVVQLWWYRPARPQYSPMPMSRCPGLCSLPQSSVDCCGAEMCLLLLLLLLDMLSSSSTLRVTRLVVPEYGEVGGEEQMTCHYHLDMDNLYSVKWYKDNQEFFR